MICGCAILNAGFFDGHRIEAVGEVGPDESHLLALVECKECEPELFQGAPSIWGEVLPQVADENPVRAERAGGNLREGGVDVGQSEVGRCVRNVA